MKALLNKLILLCVLLCSSLLAQQALASHARFGHFTWEPRPDISPTTVDFRLVVAFRRSYFGRPNLGDTFRPAGFRFGDGRSQNFNFEVIALNEQEDWIIGRAFEAGGDPGVIRHTYPSETKTNGEPWVASMSLCCRIGSLRNSANSSFQVVTRVDLSKGNTSPVSSLSPIVLCPRGSCQFSIPVLDKDDDKIQWRLTPLSESRIRSNPPGLTIDPDTGFIDWTTGSQNASLGLYAVSVTVEDLDVATDEVKSSVALDFIINLQDFVNNQPPEFTHPPTPLNNSNITAIVGQELVIDIQANDSDLNDEVFINNLGIPADAVFERTVQGNPSLATLKWSPQIDDIGDHLFTFTATDQRAASALPLSVVVNVTKPAISDVRIIDRISTDNINVDLSSFTVDPSDFRVEDGKSIIEWYYPSFDVGQTEFMNFDLELTDLLPGETRLVIHDLELSYKDVNGNPVSQSLGSRFITVAESVLDVSTTTDKLQYKADETVIITSVLSNLDAVPANGSVNLLITDTDGNLVQNLGGFTEALTASEVKQLTGLNFEVGSILAGSYKVLAELHNEAGRLVGQAESLFSVVTESGGALDLVSSVATDKPVYNAWDEVDILARIQNVASNSLVDATRSEIIILAPDNRELFRQTRDLSSLFANAVQDFNFSLSLSDAQAGDYQVYWITRDASTQELLAQSQTSFTVEKSLAQSIVGRVSVDDAVIYHTGSNACHYEVTNRSTAATGDVEFATSLIFFDQNTAVHRNLQTANLAAGEVLNWQENIDANNLTYGGYVCVLEAKYNDEWKVLNSAGFNVQAPKVTSDLTTGTQGRVLVLSDAPRECSALEDIHVSMDFESALSASSDIEVRLYTKDRTLLDVQSVSEFDVMLNSSVSNSDADLAVKAHASGQIEAFIKGSASAQLADRYIVEVKVVKNFFSKTTKEWSIDTTCDRPFTVGELYEDAVLLAYKPWLSDTSLTEVDPYGPINAPSLEAQNAVLVELLEANGWEYTLVHTAEDFTREHRLGDYSVYALLSERVMLPWLVQKEVREAVFNGRGLVTAGAFDKRNLWIESALGLSVIGRHPWATDITLWESELSQTEQHALPIHDWVSGVKLKSAEQVAEYTLMGDALLDEWSWLDQGLLSLSDLTNFKRRAITLNKYSKGKSAFFGFDLLLQATEAGTDSVYATLLTQALKQVHPEHLTSQGNSVVPLLVTLDNLRGATTGRVTLSLPVGAEVVVADSFTQFDSNWVWDFSVAEHESIQSRIYVRLPENVTQSDFSIHVATDIEGQYMEQVGDQLSLAVEADPVMPVTLDQLDDLAWQYWYRLEYRDAYYKFKAAKVALEQGELKTAQVLMITATSLLMTGSEHDVAVVRQAIDEHIRIVGQQL
jgi:hypothetical protein